MSHRRLSASARGPPGSCEYPPDSISEPAPGMIWKRVASEWAKLLRIVIGVLEICAIEHSTIQKVKMYVLNKRREPVDESKTLASVSIRVSHHPISFVLLIEA